MYLDKVNAVTLVEQIAVDYISDPTKVEKISYDTYNYIVDNDSSDKVYEEYRYVGSSPNNYVYFNCDDNWPVKGSSENDSHCEKWRIIGSMDENTTGSSNKLVKIIRDSLGSMSWDNKGNGTGSSTHQNGSNDWSDSQLMMMLNPAEYLNQGYYLNGDILVNTNTIHGRTYSVNSDGYVVYAKSDSTTQKVMKVTYNLNTTEWAGGYYNRSSNACKPSSSNLVSTSDYECNETDYSNIGLKDTAKDYIEEIIWKIGGYNTNAVTTNNMYIAERGQATVNNTRPTTWKGKVALMYATDWALATSLFTETSEGSGTYCKDTYLRNWSSYSACYNNWLYTDSWIWTLTPCSTNSYNAFPINSSLNTLNSNRSFAVRPTLYLKSSTLVTGGDGSSENPYQLMI